MPRSVPAIHAGACNSWDAGTLFIITFLNLRPRERPLSDYQYIDTTADLQQFVQTLAEEDRIAIDTEADSFHHYFEKVCLIQVSWDGRHALVDPLAELDLQPFLDLLADRELLLHGADYDLRMMRQTYGWRPGKRVLDTAIAAQILGIRRFGLQNLIEQYTGVKVPKDSQQSDWSKRPLSEKQLRYAVNDTRYLHDIVAKMEAELQEMGRLHWWHESCDAQIEATAEEREKDPDRVWRIKGHHKCDRRQLAFLKAVWTWREEEAKAIDRPPFMITNNKFTMKIACEAAELPETYDLPKLDYPRNLQGRRLNNLKQAIREAQALAPDDYPTNPKTKGTRLTPQEHSGIDRLRDKVSKLADELGIDAPFLCSKATATSIICDGATSEADIQASGDTTPWQAKLLQPLVQQV